MKPILLVNACLIGDNNGTGNTLASVFASVPDNLIYELCIDFLRTPENTDRRCFVDKYFSRCRYLLANRRKKSVQSDSAIKHRANISGARASGIKGILHEILRGCADILPVRISPTMEKFIKQSKAGYVYTCGSSITSLRIARKISAKYKIPLVLHIMDNWEETLYTSSVFTKPFSLILKNELRKANKYSNKSLAISKSLCKRFSDKYKNEYYPLMNTMDNIKNKPSCFERDTIVFLYAGSLSINRYVSLCEIAEALHKAMGNSYLFKLFVPASQNTEEIKALFGKYSVELNDYIPKEELYAEYENADVLVIAESFDKNFCDFTKYSLSTKLPEYMSSGKPILAYLSSELYSHGYLIESGAAEVAADKIQLVDKIKKLSDIKHRKALAEKGITFVKEHNSREYCSKILSEIFE